MRRRILLLGAGGQLGRTLVSLFNSEDLTELFEPSAVRHFELDVTSESAVAELINEMHPEIVINATAYTAVDAAEDDIATCFAVNRDAPGYIAKACSTVNAKLLHVSTDYVYNGDIERLHDESESLMPTGVYASSKLEGELRAMQFCENTVVIRTSWLYSPYGKNFVKTIGNLSFTKSELKVVNDQFGNPTYALDLANAIINIIRSQKWIPGIYNYSNTGPITWYEFACEIVSLLGNTDICRVLPIDSSEYPAKAKRPKYSALNCDKIRTVYGISQRDWKESLARMIDGYRECFDSVSNNR